MISQQRGLEYKGNPQEDMVKLLEYEANLQCKDFDEASGQYGDVFKFHVLFLGCVIVAAVADVAQQVRLLPSWRP